MAAAAASHMTSFNQSQCNISKYDGYAKLKMVYDIDSRIQVC